MQLATQKSLSRFAISENEQGSYTAASFINATPIVSLLKRSKPSAFTSQSYLFLGVMIFPLCTLTFRALAPSSNRVKKSSLD